MGTVQGQAIGTLFHVAAAAVPAACTPASVPVPMQAIQSAARAQEGSAPSVPTPASIAGKPVVGQIVAKSGQVIEDVHVTTTSGPCIVVTDVSHVTIRNAEIGPCGSPSNADSHGIVTIGASHVTIRGNVIHDVSTGAYITNSSHPIVFDNNYVYNIRGPFPRGQMIQTNGLRGGSGASRITCNVSDALPGLRHGVLHKWHNVEDHINLYETMGSPTARIEVAYNRVRGGHPTSKSGSGIVAGDGRHGSGWIWAHDNVVTNVRNVGMAIAGGSSITLENNRIYLNAAVVPINLGLYTNNYSKSACTDAALLHNRVWTSNNKPMWNSGTCATTVSGQVLQDASLSASMFDDVPEECR